MFGNPKTDGVGWKELDVFDSQGSCEEELQVRAREVAEKTTTKQPAEAVRRFYRCVRRP